MQWLLRPTAIIRVGDEECDSYSKPYRYALVLAPTWRAWILRSLGLKPTAELMALVNPEKHRLPPAVSSAIIRAVRAAGFEPNWRRFNKEGKPPCDPEP